MAVGPQPSGRRVRVLRRLAIGSGLGLPAFGLLAAALVSAHHLLWALIGYLALHLVLFIAWQYTVCPRCGDFFYVPRDWGPRWGSSPFRNTCVHCGFASRARP